MFEDTISILDIKTIKINMLAKNKHDALLQLSNILASQGYINNINTFIRDIYAREAEGETGIGNYIAIPHGKSVAVQKIGVAIGILNSEIEWETIDEKGVKVVILFSVGNDTEGVENHLKLLSMFARKLGNDDVVEKLLTSKKPEDVINAFSCD